MTNEIKVTLNKRIHAAVFLLLSFAIALPAFSENSEGEVSAIPAPVEKEAPAENQTQDEKHGLFGSTWTKPESFAEFSQQVSVFINIGALLTVNTESKLKSAPSPVSFSTAIGAVWPNNAFISFQPRLSFFGMYYLWDGKNALPAEVENRTALSLSMIFDLPAAATFRLGASSIEAGAGLGFLFRAGILAPNVKASDSGTEGSAGQDVDKINEWFWSGARFLYPEISVAWEYTFSERLRAGFELRYYFPIGSLASGRGFDASMIFMSTKFIF